MNVQPVNRQANTPGDAGSAPCDRQGAGLAAQPALYDSSATQGQNQAPPPSGNVGTTWKFDDQGNPVLVGYFPVPTPPGNRHVDTQWDVFKRGMTDGATHPGQTVGKIVDMEKGDTSHSGEEAGKKADNVLEKLPVIGDALGLTRGLAGEKNPDGTPVRTVPNVQPDAGDTVSSRQTGKASGSASSGETSVPESGKPGSHLEADAHSPGVLRDDKGQAYIESGEQRYPVRYDKDNGTWRVYDPHDPAKYQYPVRRDEHGNWQVHDDVGLKGGGGGPHGSAMDAQQQANIRLDLQMRHMDLEQQRQDLENQIRQFPGPEHAHRTGLELAHLDHALRTRLADVNTQLRALEQQLQQLQ